MIYLFEVYLFVIVAVFGVAITLLFTAATAATVYKQLLTIFNFVLSLRRTGEPFFVLKHLKRLSATMHAEWSRM